MRTLLGVAVSLLALGLGAAGQARGMRVGLGSGPQLTGGLPGTGVRPLGRRSFFGTRFGRARGFLGAYAPFAGYPDVIEPYGDEGPQVIVIRDERESTPAPAAVMQPKLIELPASQEGKPRPQATVPTVLVWRNGQRQEVKQYAVIGQFLYDYSKPPTPRRISLDDLDLDATLHANSERGVQFLVPTSPSEVTVRF